MTDIVERLRSPEVFITHELGISRVAYEASNEIGRLRHEIQWLRQYIKQLQTAIETLEYNLKYPDVSIYR